MPVDSLGIGHGSVLRRKDHPRLRAQPVDDGDTGNVSVPPGRDPDNPRGIPLSSSLLETRKRGARGQACSQFPSQWLNPELILRWKDRIPWLCNLHDILLRNVSSGQSVVLACSALKKMYRNILRRGEGAATQTYDEPGEKEELKLLVVYLNGSSEVISARLAKRKGHFMPPELLQSQFDTLEPPSAPENFLSLSVDRHISEMIPIIVDYVKIK
ncbi:probable gluconokinase [Gracilinanus agilis]|uniref:probable gluconokinase n=1 Tax=Gracilinanus agilis TaxID=191870 RepID=UPI001CFEE7F6|nr:probable gluconokinase [Gracilinanus agilis]